jgi:hypothetical protein
VRVDASGFGPRGLDREGVEAQFLDEVSQDARLHLEEVARAVCVLAQGHDARVTDQIREECQVVVRQTVVGVAEGAYRAL